MTSHERSEKVWNLLADFSTAVLVTADASQVLRARPMAIAGIDRGKKIWFISGRDTAKLHEISENTRVGLVCQKGHSVFLSISGDATLVINPEKVAELWQESLRVWFPDGPQDPGVVLISVTPTNAEYWDNSGTKSVTYLWETATAFLTGTTPKNKDGDQHAVVQNIATGR